MKKIRTHYDVLQVTRNASPEVIRSAYKILTQKYHPDKNGGSPESQRVMKIINEAYKVLSNPITRREYDRLIIEKEILINNDIERLRLNTAKETENEDKNTFQRTNSSLSLLHSLIEMLFNRTFWQIILLLLFVYLNIALYLSRDTTSDTPNNRYHQSGLANINKKSKNDYNSKYKDSNYTSSSYNKKRENSYENWPSQAGYINGYPILNTEGFSLVTIDNSRNSSNVFVKLYYLGINDGYPVRHFYIPAYEKFILTNVTSGRYDIRYQDLESNQLFKSESFYLQEIQSYTGIQYSNVTMTLYKVQNGNMHTYSISEDEF